jgi:predicted HTH transcriptional regulator
VQFEPDELVREIAAGEGKRLEFKRGLPNDVKVARTLCAFANTRGGLLLVGVGDRGELVGAPRPRETMERLRAVAREVLVPALTVEVGSTLLAGRRIVWCSVPLSPTRPHSARNAQGELEIVARVGASNRVATGATLRAIQTSRRGASLDPLARRILAWLAERRADERSTVAAFARAHNVGLQRARRAFTALEFAGRVSAHGSGTQRTYALT